MERRHLRKVICMILVTALACAAALVSVSCGKEEKDKALPENDAAAQAEEEKQEAPAPKPSALRLKSGKTVKLDEKGRITRKSVYRLKSGTRVTRGEIKKTGGASRYFRIYRIRKGDRVFRRINGRSYRENPYVALSDLRYIKTLYRDFSGKTRTGEIIVNKAVAGDTLEIFHELYKAKYEIRKMKLVDDYWKEGGSGTDADTASMNDDNTSGFNYRTVAGTSTISRHGSGRAIDVNPFENPWCPGGKLYGNQSASAEYADRGKKLPHMIYSDSVITRIFKEHGFRWLGETGTRDYQHFEK